MLFQKVICSSNFSSKIIFFNKSKCKFISIDSDLMLLFASWEKNNEVNFICFDQFLLHIHPKPFLLNEECILLLRNSLPGPLVFLCLDVND